MVVILTRILIVPVVDVVGQAFVWLEYHSRDLVACGVSNRFFYLSLLVLLDEGYRQRDGIEGPFQ